MDESQFPDWMVTIDPEPKGRQAMVVFDLSESVSNRRPRTKSHMQYGVLQEIQSSHETFLPELWSSIRPKAKGTMKTLSSFFCV